MSYTCVDLELLVTKQPHEKFICAICLQFMTNPCALDCQSEGKHVFGIACISQWIGHKHGLHECPLCRSQFKTMTPVQELAIEATQLSAKCPSCNTVLPILEIKMHLFNCELHQVAIRKQLEQVVEEQVVWLQKEINPHLREMHAAIYSEHVQDWKWLMGDLRNWKWWWWCSQPWWENKPCPTCNTLWHKYEQEIDALEKKRTGLLAELGIVCKEEEVG